MMKMARSIVGTKKKASEGLTNYRSGLPSIGDRYSQKQRTNYPINLT